MATLQQLVESNGWRAVTYTKMESEKVFQGIVRDGDIDWLFFESRSGLTLMNSAPVAKKDQPAWFPERPEILMEQEIDS